MRRTRGRYTIEITDEPVYPFGSADNTHSYGHDFLLASECHPSSEHGLQCFLDASRFCGLGSFRRF
jgi:hypothetical protein